MLVEIAIADAYGAGYEYVSDQERLKSDGLTYNQNPKHLGLKPGKYTDDTQMSIAVAECLLNDRLDQNSFVESFVTCFKRDPRQGYARGFQKFLESIDNHHEFLRKIRPDSEKSGAAMRAGVLGLMPSVDQIKAVAELQATITHNTPGGVTSAQAAALMVYYANNKMGSLDSLHLFLDKHLPNVAWSCPWQGPTTQFGIDICRAALLVLNSARGLTDVLTHSVSIGGDVDTLAAIAMAAASVSYLPNDLNSNLYHELENGQFGLNYLVKVDTKLRERFLPSAILSKPVGLNI